MHITPKTLLNPKMSRAILKPHLYTGNLKSEVPGDSVSTLWRCCRYSGFNAYLGSNMFGLIARLSTVGFGCFRYCLDMRLQPARIEDAVAFVQRQCSTAQLLNRTADRLSFSIPQQVHAGLLGHCCLMRSIKSNQINQLINRLLPTVV